MTWWGAVLDRNSFQPKQKNRFIVEFGNGGRLLSVSSVTKPSVSIEAKQYQMINHYYNYPGIAKWEPIEIKFVDGAVWGSQDGYIEEYTTDVDRLVSEEEEQGGFFSVAATNANFPPPINRMTSAALWEMLVASGYTPPSGYPILSGRASISSPEKASTMDISFGKEFKIHQLKPEGANAQGTIQSSETWEIFNPIITSISWGDLSYGDDGLVEYSLSVTYDWAIHHSENKIDIEGGGLTE